MFRSSGDRFGEETPLFRRDSEVISAWFGEGCRLIEDDESEAGMCSNCYPWSVVAQLADGDSSLLAGQRVVADR